MKRIIYILSLAILSLAVSSCAKEEMEAPSESNDGPKAIVIDDLDNHIDGIYDNTHDSSSPNYIIIDGEGEVLINDDGDDEDEERGDS